jgi:hypothetical protein
MPCRRLHDRPRRGGYARAEPTCVRSNDQRGGHVSKRPADRQDTVDPEGQRWAALSLLDDQPLGEVIATMAAEGVPEGAAASLCARILSDDPAFDAARVTVGQLHKLESFLDVRRQMRDLSGVKPEVERRSGLTRAEFLEEYYARNIPVILEDVCDVWPAQGLWTPDYLVETIADAEVEVMAGRNDDPDYEQNADDHKQTIAFGDFVASVVAGDGDNDSYLVANNEFLSTPAAAPLWDDFSVDHRFLTDDADHECAYFWFGPAGTVTPLHHDAMNVLFCQVVGRKRFRLVSPLDSPYLYNTVSVYSDVDPKAPDIDRFPLYANAQVLDVVLAPGESLFLPVGWWHHVESLDRSISVSFTNFVYDNDVEWYELEAVD